MPKLKLDKIVSFSSEDLAFPACNLLSDDPAKKWKCCTRGEDSVSVVLQLEQATKITALDIGNEHSAYIEVLVNRSSNGFSEDFKVLLASSSFMSALDSRQSTNVNKVRMFPHGQLSKPACDEKWDRIKIVCTQPFNKHVQYGISFITFHSTELKEQKAEVTTKALGKFTLRPESPQDFAIGSLFANRNDSTPASTLTTAAAIRQAANSPTSLQTKTPLLNKLKNSKDSTPNTSRSNDVDVEVVEVEGRKKRNRMDILYAKDEEDSNDKIDKLIAKKVEEKEKLEAEKKEKEKQESERKEKERAAKLQRNKKLQALSDKKVHKVSHKFDSDDEDSNDSKKNDNGLPPNKLNISPNIKTPNKRKAKDNGVSPKKKTKKMKKPFHRLLEGVVITISGIQNPDRADIRSKALSLGAKYKGDWDFTCTHLICAFVNTPKFFQVRGIGKIVTKQWILDCHYDRKRLPWKRYALDRNDFGLESEEEILEEDIENSEESEPELQLASTSAKADAKVETRQVNMNEPGTSKDSEQTGLPQLPNFFANKYLYIDNSLSDTDKQLLRKYITAYNGTILDDLYEATVVLTSVENVMNLKNKCPDDVEFVSADWIWECHNKQRCVSPTDFLMI